MAAWNTLGRETPAERLPAELRAILAEMKRERVAFEALTAAARESGQGLTQLMQPITDAQKVVAELQSRVKSLERLVPVLATLDEQTENVSKSQRRTETLTRFARRVGERLECHALAFHLGEDRTKFGGELLGGRFATKNIPGGHEGSRRRGVRGGWALSRPGTT